MPPPARSHGAAEFNLDLVRAERLGLDEAIYCAGKTPAQISAIVERLRANPGRALLTRLSAEAYSELAPAARSGLDYEPLSCTAILGATHLPSAAGGTVAVVCAGTSDLPMAREAQRCLDYYGQAVVAVNDVGVAGLWRLLERIEEIRTARVVIVAAGMDNALASVVGGLVASPVIALPTSVGYGVAAGGAGALHAALASCAPGVVVVNIDNGYGAACAALRIVGVRPAR
jgi:NCAIR mutase (PurE)-related protein